MANQKSLPKFYFTQPLGNPTYTSPNLATLVTHSDSNKLSIDIIILEYFIPIFITCMLYALHVARLSGQDRRSCSVMAVISGSTGLVAQRLVGLNTDRLSSLAS